MQSQAVSAPPVPTELVDALVELLGAESVITDVDGVAEFRDPYWVPGDDTYAGAIVVCPTSTEQVQGVMRLASQHGIPVWPHSAGRNNGYGGPSPRMAGSIQISLRGMNKVLEINDELAYAVVEPGVRWLDLHAELEAGGHDLMLSVPDIGWGSIIGNSMDNGMTYLPAGTDFTALTGLEVVLADGTLLRTGQGALEKSGPAWHTYKRSLGPTLDALFTQSNFGIVVRAGVALQRKPEAMQTLILTAPRDGDLEAVVQTVRELMLDGTVRGVPTIYPAPRGGALLLNLPVPQPRVWTEEALDEYAAESGLGRWAVRVAIWEDRDVAELKAKKIERRWLEAIPDGSVIPGRVYAKDEYSQTETLSEKIFTGTPTMDLIEITPDNIGHVGFSPAVPLDPTEVRYVLEQIRTRLREAGILFSGGLFLVNPRTMLIVTGIQFDRTDPDAVRNAFTVAKRLVGEIGALGYGEYRAHLDFMELATDQYSWGDHAYRHFVEKIKDAVDPEGIISPGRHGIWPAGVGPRAGS